MNVASRAWLLSEAPTSRAHAAWVRRYRAWLDLRANRLALLTTLRGLFTGIADLSRLPG